MAERAVRPADLRVAVVCGGPSEERDVSLESGAAVAEALDRRGCRVRRVAIDASVDPFVDELRDETDVTFVALHGRYGEDGTVQARLERAGITYTGSDAASSRRGMDKVESKRLCQAAGVDTPKYTVIGAVNRREVLPLLRERALSPPLVVKPVASGSSIGVSIVREVRALEGALALAWRFGEEALVEEYVEGRELTVGVLGGATLPVVELLPTRGFFDYASKYTDGLTRTECPAVLDPDVERAVRKAALAAFEAVGARDFGRVDVMLSRVSTPEVLEVNTIPGFTSHSLLPVAARAEGIAFEDLAWRIVEMAWARRGSR